MRLITAVSGVRIPAPAPPSSCFGVRPLLRRVLRSMCAQSLVASGDRVAIAVSGGADSVALAWLMHDLQASGEAPFRLAGLLHLNHHLRGAESDRDEAFVRALGERVGLVVDVADRDVTAEARASHRSIEAAAREA